MSYIQLVLDASTLILLAKAELLPAVVERVRCVITPVVRAEATRRHELYDAQVIARVVADRRVGVTRGDPALTKRLVRDFRLDVGEASSLAVAKTRGGILGTDDGLAIQACKVVGVPFVTAIHLLLRLYEQQALDRPTALVRLETLQRCGRYAPRIIEDALRQLQGGEAP